MSKKLLLSLLLVFCTPSHTAHIVVALDEFLFTIDNQKANELLGFTWTSTLWFMWYGYFSIGQLRSHITTILNEIPCESSVFSQNSGFYYGRPLPPIVNEYLLGIISTDHLKQRIVEHITAHPQLSSGIKEFFLTVTDTILTLDKLTEVLVPIPAGIELLKGLHHTYRHRLYILSNCHHDLVEALQKKFPAIFELFDGVCISSRIGMLKPHRPIFEHFLCQYQLDAQDCYYIGTTIDSLVTAQQIGMHPLLCTYNDFNNITKQLVEYGLLI